MSTEHDGFLK